MARRNAQDLVFRALAHPVRRELVQHIVAQRAVSSGALAKLFKRKMSWMGVSKHLGVLVEAGVLERSADATDQARFTFVVNQAALDGARTWLSDVASKA